ncbi:MAG: membrane protein insertion efficiency factor YidD [Kiritimatiellae bacterium]|nr:membrane protein insertion efficiency factor YidD [Kiritimatiellia bacterium]
MLLCSAASLALVLALAPPSRAAEPARPAPVRALAAAGAAPAVDLRLALELFEEGDYAASRLECMRALSSTPGAEQALLVKAMAERQLGMEAAGAALNALFTAETALPQIRMLAGYEYAQTLWRAGRIEAACNGFRQVFQRTESRELFLRAGCALSILLGTHPNLAGDSPGLALQLKSCAPLWSEPLRAECAGATAAGERRAGAAACAGRWFVAFYRTQIAPALGQRCALEPSCSEYCRQAFVKHGVLALPLQADRFVREPSVVGARSRPTRVGDTVRYPDPLEDHDWWLGGGER